jgi:hypothetical protein
VFFVGGGGKGGEGVSGLGSRYGTREATLEMLQEKTSQLSFVQCTHAATTSAAKILTVYIDLSLHRQH